MFYILELLLLVSTAIGLGATEVVNITISEPAMIACLERMNASKYKSQCSIFCFLEITDFMEPENIVKVFPGANATQISSKCGSIKPDGKKCQWANEVYDCAQDLSLDTEDVFPPRKNLLRLLSRDWKHRDLVITINRDVKTKVVRGRNMIACLERMNAEEDQSISECKLYCFLELTNFIKSHSINMNKVIEEFPETNQLELTKCSSIRAGKGKMCLWAHDAYDCVQKCIPKGELVSKSEMLNIINAIDLKTKDIVIDKGNRR